MGSCLHGCGGPPHHCKVSPKRWVKNPGSFFVARVSVRPLPSNVALYGEWLPGSGIWEGPTLKEAAWFIEEETEAQKEIGFTVRTGPDSRVSLVFRCEASPSN